MKYILHSLKQFMSKFVLVCVPFALVLLNVTTASSEEWLYTVQPGDNLWNLSKKHLVSIRYWKEIQVLNNLSDPMNIPPGSTLRFPMEWLKSGASMGKLDVLKGKVEVIERNTGKVKQAQKGIFLWENDTIRTGDESNATIVFADGSKVLVHESSELKIENLMSYGSTGMADTKVRLQSGRIHNKVIPKKGPGSRFEISTPSAIAAVRGTEYRISAEENGESKAEVVKGEVGVDSSGVSKTVDGGFGTITYSDREPLEPVKLLDPPDLSGLSSTITRVPFPVTLKPLKGALLYRMQISENKEFDSLVFDSVFSAEKIWGPDLPDRKYFLRIHGIDENGLEGLDSFHTFNMEAHPVPPLQVRPTPKAVIQEARPTFQWSEPQDAVAYRFQLARDKGFEQLLVNEFDYRQPLYTPSSDFAPGVYHWRVATKDKTGKIGPFSDTLQFRRTPPSPDMSDSELDLDEMIFRWRKGEPGHKFHCQISRDSDFSSIIVDEEVTDPQYSLKDFRSGSYFIRIAVVDSDGYAGPFSAYQTVAVPAPPAPAWTYLIPILIALVTVL